MKFNHFNIFSLKEYLQCSVLHKFNVYFGMQWITNHEEHTCAKHHASGIYTDLIAFACINTLYHREKTFTIHQNINLVGP